MIAQRLRSSAGNATTRPCRDPRRKMKDPSGGTTGRVQPYWRLGWMGARAGYSLGGFPAPTSILSPALPYTFKVSEDFFSHHENVDRCLGAIAARADTVSLRPAMAGKLAPTLRVGERLRVSC